MYIYLILSPNYGGTGCAPAFGLLGGCRSNKAEESLDRRWLLRHFPRPRSKRAPRLLLRLLVVRSPSQVTSSGECWLLWPRRCSSLLLFVLPSRYLQRWAIAIDASRSCQAHISGGEWCDEVVGCVDLLEGKVGCGRRRARGDPAW